MGCRSFRGVGAHVGIRHNDIVSCPLVRLPAQMLPKNVQYGILAVGGITAAVVLAIYLWPEPVPDSPEVLEERILEGDSVETRSQAARDMIYHGERARGSAGEALTNYRGDEREVLIPLIQAVQKARDWRALPRLFELMDSPDPWIRGKAGAAAGKILGADFGFRGNDSPEQRAKILDNMRKSFEGMEAAYEEIYPDPK